MFTKIQTGFAQKITWWQHICREGSAEIEPGHLRGLGGEKQAI